MFRRFVFLVVAALALCQPILAKDWMALQSVNYKDFYCRHRNGLGELTKIVSDLDWEDGSFRYVSPGLAGPGTVSFESKNYPGWYLIHVEYRIKLKKFDGSETFKGDASFKEVPGLTGSNTSFDSFSYPGSYLRHRDGHMWCEPDNGGTFKQDATWTIMN